MTRKSAVTRCSFPQPINTTHGPGYLIGCDPQRHLVYVEFTRKACTDSEMLSRYKDDSWYELISDDEVVTDGSNK